MGGAMAKQASGQRGGFTKQHGIRLPLQSLSADQLKQDLVVHESCDVDVIAGVASQGAVALAGLTETAGRVSALQFLLPDGWIIDIPMSEAIVEQLRRIVGSLEQRQ